MFWVILVFNNVVKFKSFGLDNFLIKASNMLQSSYLFFIYCPGSYVAQNRKAAQKGPKCDVAKGILRQTVSQGE